MKKIAVLTLALMIVLAHTALGIGGATVTGHAFTWEIPTGWISSAHDLGFTFVNAERTAGIACVQANIAGHAENAEENLREILRSNTEISVEDFETEPLECKAGTGLLYAAMTAPENVITQTVFFGVSHGDDILVIGGEWKYDKAFYDAVIEICQSVDVRKPEAMPAATQSPVAFGQIDFGNMTLAELIDARRQIQQAMWETDEWQCVEVPEGVYEIGVDIPAGHWTITLAGSTCMEWGTELDEYGANVVYGSIIDSVNKWEDPKNVSWNMAEGTYLYISGKPVIFTPYAGKPDLGFK